MFRRISCYFFLTCINAMVCAFHRLCLFNQVPKEGDGVGGVQETVIDFRHYSSTTLPTIQLVDPF